MIHKPSPSTVACLTAAALLFGAAQGAQAESYSAQITPLNSAITQSETKGEALLTVDGDQLTIDIKVSGAPANTVHWQHFHGLLTDGAASCPDASADANGDGIVDLIETEAAAGTTMVPFDNAPAAMDVAHGSYPTAGADGSYHYRQTVSLKDLSSAFAKAFKGQQLDLDKRVIFIHGVPDATRLPATVQSLGPIPAAVTLPIACGKIERRN